MLTRVSDGGIGFESSDLTPAVIAEWETRRMVRVFRELASEHSRVGAGWMASDEPGSWAQYGLGLGREGEVGAGVVDALVEYYQERGAVPQVEVLPYEDASVRLELGKRGFHNTDLSTVLYRELSEVPSGPQLEELTFRPVNPYDEGEVAALCESQVKGHFDGESPGPGFTPITTRAVHCRRVEWWMLEWKGRLVGSGGLESFDGGAALIAACVYREAAGRGIHGAFLRYRIERAKELGLRFVTISSAVGATTERNAIRAGFRVAYTAMRFSLPG